MLRRSSGGAAARRLRQAGRVTTDDGERLATWLERLGLADELAAAGLPTFARDDAGRARWTDPSTGGPLPPERLSELAGLLRGAGSDPRHGVPVELLVLARHARLRSELLDTPWHTYETLARVRGATVEATRFAVHKAASTNHLLVVPLDERSIVPAFQLDAEGRSRPDLAPVLAPLLAARMDPWRAWAWLTQPAALTLGKVPEQAVTDPDLADLVRHAAVRLAETVARG